MFRRHWGRSGWGARMAPTGSALDVPELIACENQAAELEAFATKIKSWLAEGEWNRRASRAKGMEFSRVILSSAPDT